MNWTPERLGTLQRLWSLGATASTIANTLGNTTRNAVIGKVHRLKLPDRPPAPRARSTKLRKAVSPTIKLRPGIPDLEPAPEHPPGLGELQRGQCCWPEGNPRNRRAFHFCGRPAHQIYCPHHHARSIQGA